MAYRSGKEQWWGQNVEQGMLYDTQEAACIIVLLDECTLCWYYSIISIIWLLCCMILYMVHSAKETD